MDNLDNLLKTATDDWRERSKKPMRRSALAFIALGGGSLLSGSRVPTMIGTAVVGAIAVATWYLWPSATNEVAPQQQIAQQSTTPTVQSTPQVIAQAPVEQQRRTLPSVQPQQIRQTPQREIAAPAATSEHLSSPIFPSERPKLSARDLAEERRLRELFRQAAAAAETDPAASVALFMSIARSYEERKNFNHARYALLQARDLAATGAGDSEQVRTIEEALQRLQP